MGKKSGGKGTDIPMGEKAKTPLYSRQPITAWYRPRAWGCTAGEESDAVRGSEPAADDPEDTRRSIASCVYNRGAAAAQECGCCEEEEGCGEELAKRAEELVTAGEVGELGKGGRGEACRGAGRRGNTNKIQHPRHLNTLVPVFGTI